MKIIILNSPFIVHRSSFISFMKRYRPKLWLLFLPALAYLPIACSRPAAPMNPMPPRVAAPPLFRDVTPGSGVNFLYRNGEEAGHYSILESLGGGVALFDYDGDGLLDLFVTGGGEFAGPDKKEIRGLPGRLYKNLGQCKFRDVTAEAKLDRPLFYSHGCAVADYDRDGWPDLLVTGYGRLALYHNESNGQGGRQFNEVTQPAGLDDKLWSTSAAWADFNGDGFPDLAVCHYADWSFANHPHCKSGGAEARDVCPPRSFKGQPTYIYFNDGKGHFTETGKDAGMRQDAANQNYSLGVIAVDVNQDGKPDLYVCNDSSDNFLYLNRSTPTQVRFEEVGVVSGVAFDGNGAPNGSMGVDAADYDGCGRPSLFVANFQNESHALYRNESTRERSQFRYTTSAAGIAAIDQIYVGFGAAFFDLDNDGWEDLAVTNGHVMRHPTAIKRRQNPVLLHNRGGRFQEITARGGTFFQQEHLGRGLAVGDLDNDGWPDLVVSRMNEPVAVLRNEASTETPHHWLGVELVGKDRRDVIGACFVLEAGGCKLSRFAKGGGSYLSSRDPRLLFGLGKEQRIDKLTVTWPSGREQQFTGLEADRYVRITEEESEPRAK